MSGDGDVRGSIAHRSRGSKTPTLVSPGRETVEDGNSIDGVSAEAVSEVVKTSGPPVTLYGS